MDAAWRALFGAPDPETRRRAVARIERESDDAVVPDLVAALGDADWRVRKEAVRVAAAIADRAQVVPALVTALGARDNVGLRNAAVEALATIGRAAALAILGEMPAMTVDSRRFAIEVLGEIADSAAAPALVEALGDVDANVRSAAAEALGRVGGDLAITALLAAITQSDDLLCLAALESLNRLDVAIDLPTLAGLAERRVVRAAALAALGRCPAKEAVPILARALLDRSPTTAAAAAVALGRLVGASADGAGEATTRLRALGPREVALLSERVRTGTEEERIAAVRLLGAAQHPDGLAAVVEAAADDSLVREVERALLGWGPGILDALLVLLDRTTARAASNLVPLLPALTTSRDPAPILRRLRSLLDTEEDALSASAADALGRLVATSELEGLLGAVRRGGPRTVRASCRALLAIAARDRSAVRRAILGVPLEGSGADAICEVLAAVALPEDVTIFKAALASADARVRRAAVEALASLGGPDAIEEFPFALADESPEVQAAAARALGRIGGERAVDALLAALGSSDPLVRAAAARGLADAHEPRAIPMLRDRVRSDEAMVALAALEALSALADPALGDLLVEALGHADAEVVKQALRSLSAPREARAASRIAIGLDHASWDVRHTAATLLGTLGDRSVLPALASRLAREEDGLVRAAIGEAMDLLAERHG